MRNSSMFYFTISIKFSYAQGELKTGGGPSLINDPRVGLQHLANSGELAAEELEEDE